MQTASLEWLLSFSHVRMHCCKAERFTPKFAGFVKLTGTTFMQDLHVLCVIHWGSP